MVISQLCQALGAQTFWDQIEQYIRLDNVVRVKCYSTAVADEEDEMELQLDTTGSHNRWPE